MNQNLQDRLYERQVMSIINYCKSNYEKMTEKELIQKIYKEKRFDYGFIKEKLELY